ncbi:MAG: hypothetical protein C4295_10025 [Candidatus Fervidibacterota bacterium]
MGRRIIIKAGSVTAEAELNETETAKRIYEALPLTGAANRWGDEIYFAIPVDCPPENQREVVNTGDLGYWVPGSAFCIFFGPTPASRSPDEIRPASPVNVFGHIVGDPTVFRAVREGETVVVEPAP